MASRPLLHSGISGSDKGSVLSLDLERHMPTMFFLPCEATAPIAPVHKTRCPTISDASPVSVFIVVSTHVGCVPGTISAGILCSSFSQVRLYRAAQGDVTAGAGHAPIHPIQPTRTRGRSTKRSSYGLKSSNHWYTEPATLLPSHFSLSVC